MTRLADPTEWTSVDVFPHSGQTGAAVDDSLVAAADHRTANRKGWQRIIDSTLIEWGRDPSQLEDEDVTAPTQAVIARATRLAVILRDNALAPPNRAVTNGDGGVVFERWEGPVFEQIEIADDGAITITSTIDSEIVRSRRLI